MPELPEVEVVKRSLINKAQNSIIKAIKINDDKLRYKVDKKQIKKIIGLKLQKILRRSKILLFFIVSLCCCFFYSDGGIFFFFYISLFFNA